MTAQYAKPPVEPFQFARNGKYPDALFQAELVDAKNRCALFRMKQLANFWSDTMPNTTFGDIERTRWRFRFVSSPNVSAVMFKVVMAQTTPESTSSRPRCRLRIANNAGTAQADAEIHFGASSAAGSDPNELAHGVVWVSASGLLTPWQPTASTEYQATISDFDNACVLAATIYEIPLNLQPSFLNGYAAGTPIFDSDRQSVTTALRDAWKYQAAPLFHWTVDVAGSPRTRSSSTAANVIDNASTGVFTSTPGFTLDLRNRSRISTGTVPVKFWAYGSVGAGTGGVVKLKDSGGSAVATISAITTAGWYSTTANLPATLAKYDLHYEGDGTNTFSFAHASLLQYTA